LSQSHNSQSTTIKLPLTPSYDNSSNPLPIRPYYHSLDQPVSDIHI